MRYALTEVVETLVGHPVPERGVNVMLRCPLPTHPERDPSFSINLDKGLWLCHACGEKGGLEKLARLLEQEVDRDDIAVRRALELAASAGFEEPRDFWDIAVRWELQPDDSVPGPVRAFCKSRAINRPALYAYRVGWQPDRRRIVFPYWDESRCVAVKYRYVDQEGTKFNKGSEEGSKASLFGVDLVRGKPVVVVCEGESDTLSVWSFLNRTGLVDGVGVAGVPGASKTYETWQLWALDFLWAQRVYVAYDGDDAGDKGAETAIKAIGSKAVRLRPPDGLDMAAYLKQGSSLAELGMET